MSDSRAGEFVAHDLQVRMAPLPIGLEVIALGPLVPGLDEQQPFVGGLVAHAVDGRATYARKRSGVDPRSTTPRAPLRGVLSQRG